VVAELGSLSRFASPSQLMGYSGLVSSEYTTGNRVQRGAIIDRPIFRHFSVVMRSSCSATAKSRLSRRRSLCWILGSSR